jgi:ADP-ribosylglycohydrolase
MIGSPMLGAIAGDIIESVHEYAGTRRGDFPLFVPESDFTDDTVLTVAERGMARLDDRFRKTVERFYEAYGISTAGWNRK